MVSDHALFSCNRYNIHFLHLDVNDNGLKFWFLSSVVLWLEHNFVNVPLMWLQNANPVNSERPSWSLQIDHKYNQWTKTALLLHLSISLNWCTLFPIRKCGITRSHWHFVAKKLWWSGLLNTFSVNQRNIYPRKKSTTDTKLRIEMVVLFFQGYFSLCVCVFHIFRVASGSDARY